MFLRYPDIKSKLHMQLIIPSHPEAIEAVTKKIKSILASIDVFQEEPNIFLHLAISEMLSNALEYGSLELTEIKKRLSTDLSDEEYYHLFWDRIHSDPYQNRKIFLDLKIMKNQVKVVITDEGKGFDTEYWLNEKNTLKSPTKAGKSVQLCKNIYLDKMYYNSQGNKVTLIKKYGARKKKNKNG